MKIINETMITSMKNFNESINYDKEYIKSLIENKPDFPKQGINFKDIQKLLMDSKARKFVVNDIYKQIKNENIDVVLGLDARGFILGPRIADELDAGFAMVRKKGKLPPPVIETDYDLEYGKNTITVSPEIIKPEMNVHIHDDLLATGGTINAAIKLLNQIGCNITSISFIIELSELNGRNKIDEKIYSVLIY